MKRAALYIRVSTEEQAKYGFSLAEQQHDLGHYAAQHGYTVIGVYADEEYCPQGAPASSQ